MNHSISLLAVGLTLLLGFRHGIDWDHIAAIADVTGAEKDQKRALWLSFCYAGGHGFVVSLLGLLAIAINLHLPAAVDDFMEPVVGVSLIVLSGWLAWSMFRQGAQFTMRSRWQIAADLLNIAHTRLFRKGKSHPHLASPIRDPGPIGCTVIGVIHGFGAETPTQVLTILTAASARDFSTGSLILFSFVFAMMVSNMTLAIISVFGYSKARNSLFFQRALGTLTIAFSFSVGVMFLAKKAHLLPALGAT